jgi:hypothetical protein
MRRGRRCAAGAVHTAPRVMQRCVSAHWRAMLSSEEWINASIDEMFHLLRITCCVLHVTNCVLHWHVTYQCDASARISLRRRERTCTTQARLLGMDLRRRARPAMGKPRADLWLRSVATVGPQKHTEPLQPTGRGRLTDVSSTAMRGVRVEPASSRDADTVRCERSALKQRELTATVPSNGTRSSSPKQIEPSTLKTMRPAASALT